MYEKSCVLAGIVTYNPELERLQSNICALLKQVDHIFVIDNGSLQIDDVVILVKSYGERVSLKQLNQNMGIAFALREVMQYAKDRGYSWTLCLDQDSIIEAGLVYSYLNAANEEQNQDVGMFTCLIKDRNFVDKKYEEQDVDYLTVPYCITSASFTNVEKYFQTDGYDKTFFIDAVDFDVCYTLREAGFRVVRVNHVGLYHEVGHGENRHFLWKKIVVYHQKPIRIYYYARNLIWMHKKHPRLYTTRQLLKTELALFVRILIYEDHKWQKIKAFFRGVFQNETAGVFKIFD